MIPVAGSAFLFHSRTRVSALHRLRAGLRQQGRALIFPFPGTDVPGYNIPSRAGLVLGHPGGLRARTAEQVYAVDNAFSLIELHLAPGSPKRELTRRRTCIQPSATAVATYPHVQAADHVPSFLICSVPSLYRTGWD